METVTSRQSEIQKFIADGCKEALLEEKRRFCFLVDKHCSFANHMHHYHLQVSVRLAALSVAGASACTQKPLVAFPYRLAQ